MYLLESTFGKRLYKFGIILLHEYFMSVTNESAWPVIYLLEGSCKIKSL